MRASSGHAIARKASKSSILEENLCCEGRTVPIVRTTGPERLVLYRTYYCYGTSSSSAVLNAFYVP